MSKMWKRKAANLLVLSSAQLLLRQMQLRISVGQNINKKIVINCGICIEPTVE